MSNVPSHDQLPSGLSGRIIPLVLAVALFMENMDSTIIATSLPAIAADIGTNPISLKLALTTYLVALAIFIPISGWMADRFGARRVFATAIGIFVIGSILCAVSGSLAAFVGARFLQGMGGAMMTPIARLVLVRATAKSELVSAMAWLTFPALVGPLVGPPVGGFITTYASWHWIFLINVPIGMVGIWLALTLLPQTQPSEKTQLDVVGFVLSGVAASGIVFGLSVVSLPALSPYVGVAALMLGLISGVAYLLHARRARHPLLVLGLLRNQIFRSSIIGGSIFRIGIGAVPFLLPLMFQLGFGFTPFQSGMITFVTALGAMGMKLATAWIFRQFGFRPVLIAGSLVTAFSIAIMGFFTPSTPVWLMMLIIFAGGFIRSMFFTGVNAFSYAEISPEDTSKATPILSVAQQLSIAIGVALAGLILEVQSSQGGQSLSIYDFHVAFFVIAAVSALAAIAFWWLPPDAGSNISGHVSMARSTTPITPPKPDQIASEK